MSNAYDTYEKTVVLRERPAPAPAAEGVRPGVAEAKLLCLDDTYLSDKMRVLEVRLRGPEQTIGRSEDNSICIDSQDVSRQHARLFLDGTVWGIEDLGSRNGIRVNKKKVSRAALEPGDRIDIGRVPFRFVLEEGGGAAAAPEEPGVFEQTVVIGKGGAPARPGADIEETAPMESVRLPSRGRQTGWLLLIGVAVFGLLVYLLLG